MPTQYFLNQETHQNEREIFPMGSTVPASVKVRIGEMPCSENFLGFGVAITPSSCYLLNQMEREERTALLREIYGKDGLNLSVGRVCVGSSDYSAELYSYDDVPFDTELKHFSVARDEKYVIPMIQEVLKVRPDLYLFASPWSPPGWMKTGGSMCGGHMREEFVECYAEYYIKFLKAYADRGIHIRALTPQNEMETTQRGRMPACIWHPEIEAKFIRILRKKLDENGMDVKIWMWDYSFNGTDRVLWSLDNLEGLAESADGIGFHYYNGHVEETKKLRTLYPDLELHFTEAGPRLYDNYDSDYVKWSILISKCLHCGYRSFTGWNLMLDEMGGPNVGPFFCGGLVTRNSLTGEISYSGQSKAFRMIAPYVTPSSKIYPLYHDEELYDCLGKYPKLNLPMEGFFIDNGTEKVFVMINPSKDKKQVSFTHGGQNWYAELLSDTVSVIVF